MVLTRGRGKGQDGSNDPDPHPPKFSNGLFGSNIIKYSNWVFIWKPTTRNQAE
jgi:hypothetical protein